jgi:tetratricopeptide (TPR) repeat protein
LRYASAPSIDFYSKVFYLQFRREGRIQSAVYLAAGRHSEAKQMFEDSITICQQIGDRSKEASALSGMGRTLRLAGDLEGARQKEEQARGVFAEIGDRAQAQQTIALAESTLDQDEFVDTLAAARRAAHVFEPTRTERDAAMAGLLEAKALLMEGSQTEARVFIEPAIKITQTSHDRELELSARVMAARIEAASKNPADLNQAVGGLDAVLTEATAGSFEAIAFEARLALGQIELNSRKQSSGRAHLAALEKEADRRGFQLVARKAAAALRVAHDQASGHPPSQDKYRALPRSTRA